MKPAIHGLFAMTHFSPWCSSIIITEAYFFCNTVFVILTYQIEDKNTILYILRVYVLIFLFEIILNSQSRLPQANLNFIIWF